MTNIDTSTENSTDANTEKLKAAYEVLKDEALIKKMIKAHKIGVDVLDAFKKAIDEARAELIEDEKKDLLNQVKVLAAQKGLSLDPIALKALFPDVANSGTEKEDGSKRELKWLRFKHDGKEYFIKRSTSGRVKGELAEYLTSNGKTLAELVVDESKVVQSNVVAAKELGTLTKKSASTQ